MADTYRQGFDGKWPGETAGNKPEFDSKADSVEAAHTIQEPGDPMDAHDTFRGLNANLGKPDADLEVQPKRETGDVLRARGDEGLGSHVEDVGSKGGVTSLPTDAAQRVQDAESTATSHTDQSSSGGIGEKIKSVFSG